METAKSTPKLVVVLPAYNEADNIARVVAGVRAVKLPGVEIIPLVVDDGSKDETGRIAREAGAVVLTHSPNRGVGAAFRTGLEWARAEGAAYLIHMDSDGQVLPEEIPIVARAVLAGEADLSLGCRFLGERPPHLAAWKAFGLRTVARTIGVLTGYRLHDLSCGFRCMNRAIMDAVNPSFDYDYIQETLIQALGARARVVEVPITVLYEEEPVSAGMSGQTLRYTTRFFGLTGFALGNFYRRRLSGG